MQACWGRIALWARQEEAACKSVGAPAASVAMAGLILFVGLWACAVWTAWRLRAGWGSLKRYGMGRAEEDLDKARRIFRDCSLYVLALLVMGAVIVVMGLRWAPQWRETWPGAAFLTILALGAGTSLVWSSGYVSHHRWSRNGSWKGLMLGLLWSAVSLCLVDLAVYWRWG